MKTENSKPAAAEDQTRRPNRPEISAEEIRQRQRSMLNAMLCCMI